MSNGRRICVCGRERGKEPVLITITTCRHKHPSKPGGEGSFCISSPPLARSSPIHDTQSKKIEEKTEKTEHQSAAQPESADDDKTSEENKPDETAYTTALEDNETAFESALASEDNETAFESALADHTQAEETKEASEFTEDPVNETSELPEESQLNDTTEVTENDTTEVTENDTTEVTENDTTEVTENETTDGNIADESEANENEDTNQTVMMLETAVNTMPFLDNLFWSRNASKSMPDMSNDNYNLADEECTVELFIFEKHAKSCRHNFNKFRNENSFFDGETFLEAIGKISFPTCTNNESNAQESQNKNTFTTDSEANINHYRKIFKTLETYIKNKQFYEALNRKTIGPFDVKLQRYITMGKEMGSRKSSKCNIEELYLKKITTDRSVQFKSVYSSNMRTSRWYDGLLLCFGVKNDEDFYETEELNENFPSKAESSYLITKYLKI